MANKIEVSKDVSTRLINHGPVALVTTAYKGKNNVMTAAWVMPVSHTPRIVAVALVPKRYTYELIQKTKEFILNIPSVDQKEMVINCGKLSGRDKDKFLEYRIKTISALKLAAPLIEDCVAHIECKLQGEKKVGDHIVLFGEVVAASANEGLVNENGMVNVAAAKMLHHLGGSSFTVSEREV